MPSFAIRDSSVVGLSPRIAAPWRPLTRQPVRASTGGVHEDDRCDQEHSLSQLHSGARALKASLDTLESN
jgi:hypothetical protein